MEQTDEVQLGILLVLFGGFILIDTNSRLPLGFEFLIMVFGLLIGTIGAIYPQ